MLGLAIGSLPAGVIDRHAPAPIKGGADYRTALVCNTSYVSSHHPCDVHAAPSYPVPVCEENLLVTKPVGHEEIYLSIGNSPFH